jgi:NTP pyrophosphatase (non-canonical NTP hydrolase)
MDKTTTVADLKLRVRQFCEERGWDEVHKAKDLAIGIITEASELLEHFRFKSEDEIRAFFKQPQKRRAIVEEMCDVLFPLLRFADLYNVDLTLELARKMKKSARKYPKLKGKKK